MTNYICTEERFLKDVAEHSMTILNDDGLNRHLRFKKEGTSSYYFDIVTWADRLVVSGDMGTYVFSRITDMFDFFRTKRHDWNFNKDGLSTNPSYWSEKLLSISTSSHGTGSIYEFDEARFNEVVKEYFDNHFQDEIENEKAIMDDIASDEGAALSEAEKEQFAEAKEKRDDLWREIQDRVLYAVSEEEAYVNMCNFKEDAFEFMDCNEHRLTQYKFHYIWNCYAIAFAIKQYDTHKETTAAT